MLTQTRSQLSQHSPPPYLLTQCLTLQEPNVHGVRCSFVRVFVCVCLLLFCFVLFIRLFLFCFVYSFVCLCIDLVGWLVCLVCLHHHVLGRAVAQGDELLVRELARLVAREDLPETVTGTRDNRWSCACACMCVPAGRQRMAMPCDAQCAMRCAVRDAMLHGESMADRIQSASIYEWLNGECVGAPPNHAANLTPRHLTLQLASESLTSVTPSSRLALDTSCTSLLLLLSLL